MEPNQKPKIIVISGPSGAGKNAVSQILRRYPEEFVFSISATTRKEIRPGEVNGQDYHFISDEEFDQAIDSNDFLEWENIHQYRYGTKKSDFDKLIRSGKTVVMVIDVKGGMNIKKWYPEAKTVFIIPPGLDVLEQRLRARGTENESSIETRKQRYLEELPYKDRYDSIVINDNLEQARQELLELARSI